MRLRAEAKDPASVEANVLAVPIYKEDDPFAEDLANLDAAAGGVIRGAIEWGGFNIAEDYSALIGGGDLPVEHILLLNGVRRGRGPWRARRMAGVAHAPSRARAPRAWPSGCATGNRLMQSRRPRWARWAARIDPWTSTDAFATRRP